MYMYIHSHIQKRAYSAEPESSWELAGIRGGVFTRQRGNVASARLKRSETSGRWEKIRKVGIMRRCIFEVNLKYRMTYINTKFKVKVNTDLSVGSDIEINVNIEISLESMSTLTSTLILISVLGM